MKPYILHITTWYPNSKDPQLGIFIKKHIDAARLNKQFEHVILNVSAIPILEPKLYNVQGNTALQFFKALKQQVKKIESQYGKPSVIHSHVIEKKALATLWLCKHFRNSPLFITEHWTGYRLGKFTALNPVFKAAIKQCYKKAKLVSTVSKALLNDLENNNIKVKNHIKIPNVVDGKPNAQKKPTPKLWKIAFVADMVNENKNLFGFVMAIETCVNKGLNLSVEAIGGGTDLAAMQSVVSAQNLSHLFNFSGRQTNDYVLETFENCHLYVCSSFVETFSVATAEAMFKGLPVVVTPCGGPEEFVNNKSGIVTKSTNPRDIAKGIQLVIDNYTKYNAEAISTYVNSLFSADKVGKQLNDCYLKLKNLV